MSFPEQDDRKYNFDDELYEKYLVEFSEDIQDVVDFSDKPLTRSEKEKIIQMCLSQENKNPKNDYSFTAIASDSKTAKRTQQIFYLICSIAIWCIGIKLGAANGQRSTSQSDWMGLGYLFGFLLIYFPAFIVSYLLILRALGIKKKLQHWISAIVVGVVIFEPITFFALKLLNSVK